MRGELTELRLLDAQSDALLVQRYLLLEGAVNDPDIGLGAANGRINDILTLDLDVGSVLAQGFEQINGGLTNLGTGVSGNASAIQVVNQSIQNINGGITALQDATTALGTTVNDASTGVAATSTAVSGLVSRANRIEDNVSVLSGRADVLEVGLRAAQLIPNGDFATGSLLAWEGVPGTFSIIQRGSETTAVVQEAPRLFILKIASSANSAYANAVVDLDVAGGDMFHAALYGATYGGGAATSVIRFNWYDATGKYIGAHHKTHLCGHCCA